MSNHSARLVEHLAALKPTLLDGAIGASATMALLDTLGCGLYGANQQWGRILRAQILHEGSRGMATLFGENVTVAPSRAALANGTASHGFELDDIIQGALVHPGAVVIPAALAVAEQSGASGERLLLGIVAGYEVIARLGWALGAEHNTRGYHTTGVAGPIAATVAAGIVLGLSMEIILSAIGIACSSAGGIKAFTQGTGGMVKRMHAGRAAETGVLACELAQRGFTGPMAGVDGRFGLLEVIGGADSCVEALTNNLGHEYANLPTVAEAALPGYAMITWYGLFAAAATPRAVIFKLHADVARALKMPDLIERLTRDGSEPVASEPAVFDAHVRAEIENARRIVKTSGMQLD